MRVLIIEDEVLAADKLHHFLSRYQPDIQVVTRLDSVAAVMAYFQQPTELDLIISDIELSDGAVFNALEQLDLPCPVLFTTAYDQYWQQVFQYHAIDYLLKPFTYPRFVAAMHNLTQLQQKLLRSTVASNLAPRAATESSPNNSTTAAAMADRSAAHGAGDIPCSKAYKQRFLLRKGQQLAILPMTEVRLIQAANGVLLATDTQQQVHILSENNISEVELMLDPQLFFRLNRSDIIHIDAIATAESYSKDSLAVHLRQHSRDQSRAPQQNALITSKSRTALFRKWLNQ
jgi:DNA-binding LytR/AlgR family response regulator